MMKGATVVAANDPSLMNEVMKWFVKHPDRNLRNTRTVPVKCMGTMGVMECTMYLMWQEKGDTHHDTR